MPLAAFPVLRSITPVILSILARVSPHMGFGSVLNSPVFQHRCTMRIANMRRVFLTLRRSRLACIETDLANLSSSRAILSACSPMSPLINVISRHSSVSGVGLFASNSPYLSASMRFLARFRTSGESASPPSNGKNARRLRSPCLTALVLPNGAPAPFRLPPHPDLDCWLFFFI